MSEIVKQHLQHGMLFICSALVKQRCAQHPCPDQNVHRDAKKQTLGGCRWAGGEINDSYVADLALPEDLGI